jgi:hypothetical protein
VQRSGPIDLDQIAGSRAGDLFDGLNVFEWVECWTPQEEAAGCGRAFADSDPARALDAYREGLDYGWQRRIMQFESVIA